jgi:diketogulonate reductase-like aldo/keto reductase
MPLQAVIPQSSKKLHIQSNLELDDFTLTSEQLLKIDARDGALS